MECDDRAQPGGGAGGGDEAAGVAQVADVQQHRAGIGIAGEPIQHQAEAHIGIPANAGDGGEAHAVRRRPIQHHAAQGGGLGDQGEPTRRRGDMGAGEVQLPFRHHHAERAGAEGADAGGARRFPHPIGHAGHRHAARTERGQGLEHRQHRPIEGGEHGEVGRRRKLRHGLHRLQRAFEAALFQVGAQLPAGGRAGAEDGDGARAEHLLRPEFSPCRGAILGHRRTLHHATGLHAALPRR